MSQTARPEETTLLQATTGFGHSIGYKLRESGGIGQVREFAAYVEQSQQAETVNQLHGIFSDTVRAHGYENVILTSVRGREVDQLHWLEFPEGYAAYYFDKNWQKIDPILACALRARRPFIWEDAVVEGQLTKPQLRMLDECKDSGVHSGIAFPFHGPGNKLDLLSISRRTKDPANPESLCLLQLVSMQTWTRFLELTEDSRFPRTDEIKLTGREIEILEWSKYGKSYADIADILSISNKTVEFHMYNAMDKLGANNKISAVVVAIHRGLIDVD